MKIGDRVHVEFDGTVAEFYGDDMRVDVSEKEYYWIESVNAVNVTPLLPAVEPGDVWLPGHMFVPFIAVGDADGNCKLYGSAAARALRQDGYEPAEFFSRFTAAKLIARRSEYDSDEL